MTARQPLVLVPGLLCDALLWQPQIGALADSADCWVAEHRQFDTIAQLAEQILTQCPFERFALAGLSMGGYLSFELIRQAPQRVTRLALLDTSARPDTPEQRVNRQRLIGIAHAGRFDTVIPMLWPMLVHEQAQPNPELRAVIETMARNTGVAAYVRQQTAITMRIDSRPSLAAIDCPTLVLCGRDDQLTPLDRHQEIAGAIAGARLHVLERCGHMSTLERPRQVNDALRDWLGWH